MKLLFAACFVLHLSYSYRCRKFEKIVNVTDFKRFNGIWYIHLEFFNPPSYVGKPYIGGLRCPMINGVFKGGETFVLNFYGFNGNDLLKITDDFYPDDFNKDYIHITVFRPNSQPVYLNFKVLDTDYDSYAMFYTCVIDSQEGYDMELIQVATRFVKSDPQDLYILKGRADTTLQRLAAPINAYNFMKATQDCIVQTKPKIPQ